MYDLATQTGRKRISHDFNHLFLGLDHKAYARKLGVSERTARRLRAGERVPHKVTARRMLDESTRIRDLAAKDDAEFARYIEEVRRANAEKQGKIRIERMCEEGISKTVPKWYIRAELAFFEGKFEVAAAILADRLEPEEIEAVELALRPYAITCLGLSYQYLGHPSDATERYRDALQAGLFAHRPPAHIAWFRTNLAGGLVRMRELEDALVQCRAAIDDSISHLPAYYVALCASDALRDPHRLAIWIGRTIQAAKSTISPSRLEEFLLRADDDPDLAWARNQAAWADMTRDLRSIIASVGQA
jgi:tetratricopeptide (TPR) repeat protein